ncbi:MAG: hypothetical protein EAZ15_04675 [Sphingobacteriales bacterium]|nr:MAG: hypothetical protein EAZ15_04675 [Sphingobacteriales bacterium]
MTVTYNVSRNELNADLIELIKLTFKTERVLIQIAEDIDETERIMANKKLCDKILKADDDFSIGANVVKFEGNLFSEKYSS